MNMNFEELVYFFEEIREKRIMELLLMFKEKEMFGEFKFEQIRNITNSYIFKMIIVENKDSDDISEQKNDMKILKIRQANHYLNFEEYSEFISKLNENNLCPKQYLNYFDEVEGILISIEKYIETNDIFIEHYLYNQDFISKMINSLVKLNLLEFNENYIDLNNKTKYIKQNINIQNKNDIRERFENYLNYISEICQEQNLNYLSDNSKEIKQVSDFIENMEDLYLKNIPENKQLCFCHGDFHDGNIIYDEKETNEFYFIDFEDLSFNYIGYDLANFLTEWVYKIGIDKYPHFNYPASIFDVIDLETMLRIYKQYIEELNLKLKEKGDENLVRFDENDFIKMMSLSIINAALDLIYCLDEKKFMKKGTADLILVMNKRFKTIEEFNKLLSTNNKPSK